jgi:hypothetical protein
MRFVPHGPGDKRTEFGSTALGCDLRFGFHFWTFRLDLENVSSVTAGACHAVFVMHTSFVWKLATWCMGQVTKGQSLVRLHSVAIYVFRHLDWTWKMFPPSRLAHAMLFLSCTQVLSGNLPHGAWCMGQVTKGQSLVRLHSVAIYVLDFVFGHVD